MSSLSLHTDSQALEEFLSHSMGSVNAHPVERLPTAACTAYLVGRAPGPNATHSFSMPCAAACGTPSAVVFNFCASFSAWRTGGSLDRPAPAPPANKPSKLLKTSRFSPALRIFVRPSPSTKNAHFLAVSLELVMAEARGPSGCYRAAYTEASRLGGPLPRSASRDVFRVENGLATAWLWAIIYCWQGKLPLGVGTLLLASLRVLLVPVCEAWEKSLHSSLVWPHKVGLYSGHVAC